MRQWRWVLGAILAIMLMSPPAYAASVKEIMESYRLIGTFAWDCSKPASRSNNYFVHRVIDNDHVQRDMMTGPSERGFVVIIDKATGTGPNEIFISGTRDGKPLTSTYRIEGDRFVVAESTWDNRVIVKNSRQADGFAIPWTSRCQ
jgi:hypothetical protein